MKIMAHENNLFFNPFFSCELIWTSIKEWSTESSANESGLSIPQLCLILPLVYHYPTVEAMGTKQKPGALTKALMEDRSIVINLNERMMSFFDLTLESINLGITSDLLCWKDVSGGVVGLGKRKTLGQLHYSEDALLRVAASKRIGQAFAESSPSQLYGLLGLR